MTRRFLVAAQQEAAREEARKQTKAKRAWMGLEVILVPCREALLRHGVVQCKRCLTSSVSPVPC